MRTYVWTDGQGQHLMPGPLSWRGHNKSFNIVHYCCVLECMCMALGFEEDVSQGSYRNRKTEFPGFVQASISKIKGLFKDL